MPGAPSIDIAKAALAFNLADAGLKPIQIAAQTGLARPSVHDILNKHGRWGEVAERPVFNALRQQQQQTLEVAFRSASATLLERAMDPEKLLKASTYQLVISSGIALDKSRLLAGEPTEITASIDLHLVGNLDNLAARLAETLINIRANVSSETNAVIVDKTNIESGT